MLGMCVLGMCVCVCLSVFPYTGSDSGVLVVAAEAAVVWTQ